jgi:hypothetical protein
MRDHMNKIITPTTWDKIVQGFTSQRSVKFVEHTVMIEVAYNPGMNYLFDLSVAAKAIELCLYDTKLAQVRIPGTSHVALVPSWTLTTQPLPVAGVRQ